MKEINLKDILNYKSLKKSHSDYDYGGWYMIKCVETNKKYVGKSIEYMFRLRQHVKKSNPTMLIDLAIKEKSPESFKYYLLKDYSVHGVNFFNRKLETIIEHSLIKKHNTKHPNGYNKRYYEQL